MSAEIVHINQSSSSMDELLQGSTEQTTEWSTPEIFDMSEPVDQVVLRRRFAESKVAGTVDSVSAIANELYELQNPDKQADTERRATFVSTITEQGAAYGKWVLFPWSNKLVRYPEREMHRELRTSRFKNLVTDEEQDKLYDATVAAFGLSVGSSVVEGLVSAGVGGRIIMGDPDRIAPTNLGRIRASFLDVGARKLDVMAKKISEADPYLEQVHFPEGFTQECLGELALLGPDVLFDEVDNFAAKAQMRRFAREQRIPLIMATDVGDRSLVDVERYDLEDAQPFHGRLTEQEVEDLAEGRVSRQEMGNMTVRVVGMENISQRTLQSFMEAGKTLPGIPQLGTTASIGGNLATIAARQIILGRDLPTGRYFSADQMLDAA